MQKVLYENEFDLPHILVLIQRQKATRVVVTRVDTQNQLSAGRLEAISTYCAILTKK